MHTPPPVFKGDLTAHDILDCIKFSRWRSRAPPGEDAYGAPLKPPNRKSPSATTRPSPGPPLALSHYKALPNIFTRRACARSTVKLTIEDVIMTWVAGKLGDGPTLKAESEVLLLMGVTAYSGKAGNSGALLGVGADPRGMSR